MSELKPCVWQESDEFESNDWLTECRQMFVLNDGTPTENSFRFCCYCGGPLVQKRYIPEDEPA